MTIMYVSIFYHSKYAVQINSTTKETEVHHITRVVGRRGDNHLKESNCNWKAATSTKNRKKKTRKEMNEIKRFDLSS